MGFLAKYKLNKISDTLYRVDIGAMPGKKLNEIVTFETKKLDLVVFNLFLKANVIYPDRLALFKFIENNEEIFNHFEKNFLKDQKFSKLFFKKEFDIYR